MGELIAVPFAGEGAGEDELTWGQQHIWATIQRSGGALNMGGVQSMPPTTTVDEVARLLGFIIGRHQCLRTRLRPVPGAAPRQVVSANGVAALEVVDVETVDPVDLVARYNANSASGDTPLVLADPHHPTPEEVAEAVRMRFLEPFDEEHDWPVRMAVIRLAGTIRYLVAMYNHVAIDGEGLGVLVDDLSTMDPSTGAATSPVPGPAPLDLVRLQRTPAHQARSDRALRHWEKVLRTVPARRFDPPVRPSRPRYWELEFDSPAAELAMRAIAARCRVDTKPVLLGAFAAAMFRLTGISPSAAQILVNNRFRPGLAGSVSPLNQPGLCVIEVDGVPFEEVVSQAARAIMTAGMHAYYDPARHAELVAAIGRERGEQIDLSCFVNDRRMSTRSAGASVPTAQDVRDALPRSELRWRRRLDRPNPGLYFHVGDTPGIMAAMLAVDTAVMNPDQMIQLVRDVEDVTVGAVTGERVPG